MATLNFAGTEENVVTREEFPLSKAQEILKDEVVAVIGYGVQGPGQALNQRDNGINVIVGQRKNSKSWDKAIQDGFVEGKTLFEIEEALEKGTIICYLLSDAAQIALWPTVKKYLTPGKALYFSHGFGITYNDQTEIIPPKDVDVFLVAPKGSGTRTRRRSRRAGSDRTRSNRSWRNCRLHGSRSRPRHAAASCRSGNRGSDRRPDAGLPAVSAARCAARQ